MSWDNTPDDWHSYWGKCQYCGRRYHASEGGCDCLDEGSCVGCGALCGREELDESTINNEERIYRCGDCAQCVDCGETFARSAMKDVEGDLYCEKCGHEQSR